MRPTARGFSLTEILVVLALAGLAIAICVPLVAENVNQAAGTIKAPRGLGRSGNRTMTASVPSNAATKPVIGPVVFAARSAAVSRYVCAV